MSLLLSPVRKVPVFCGDFAVDLVDECRALQMRRHSRYVHLKRRHKTQEIVAVILESPTLLASDWRADSHPVSSLKTTKHEELSRDTAYKCSSCGAFHGGLSCGSSTVIQHKTPVLTQQWPAILRHEMQPLYKTSKTVQPEYSKPVIRRILHEMSEKEVCEC